LQNTLSELVALHVDRLKSLRGADPATIIAAARAAVDAIEAAVGQPSRSLTDDERAALMAAQRLAYNAAADGWPGWDDAPPPRPDSPEDLRRGFELACRSQVLVQRLDLGPVRQGTGQWMIGAYHLALDEIDAALTSFGSGLTQCELAPAPGLAWLLRGYIAIAHEVAGRPLAEGVATFDEVQAAIRAGAFDDASEWCDQLTTARRVFARPGARP